MSVLSHVIQILLILTLVYFSSVSGTFGFGGGYSGPIAGYGEARYGSYGYGPYGGGQADPWNGNWAGNGGGHISRNYDIGYSGPAYRRTPQPPNGPIRDLNVPAEALRTRPPGSFYHNPMMPIREADGKWFMLTGERVDIRNRAEGTY